MRIVTTQRLVVVQFGRNRFLMDASGKLYTLGYSPEPGEIQKYRTHTGQMRFVFTSKGK